MAKRKSKTPYVDRPLEDQIASNWRKTKSLYRRGEYSTVVIRAATTVELAANLLIRAEFQERRDLPKHFVDSLMIWANGFMGKVDRLLIPIHNGTESHDALAEVRTRSKDINDERNNVVHRGQFKTKKTARRVIKEAAYIINTLAKLSGTDFRVDDEIDEDDEDDA